MNYELIYPLKNLFLNGYIIIAIIFLIIAISSFMIILDKYKRKQYSSIVKVIILIIFSIFIMKEFFSIGRSYPIDKKFLQILKEKKYLEVHGKVENYVPMNFDGKKDESFLVNGVYFKYNHYVITGAFNLVKSKGNPIKEGSIVRIKYYIDKKINRNLILMLELKK